MTLFIEDRIILDLCGGTGSWSAPYKEAGYDVRLVTMPEQDVRLFVVPDEPIWGILAAPPCTHFASSGARWWAEKGTGPLFEALSIVDACLRIIWVAQPEWWCLENPVGRLTQYLGSAEMSFNPCDYGDPYTKRTLLWGKFNVPNCIEPVEPVRVCSQGSWLMQLGGKSERTKTLRSVTPPGFARAFFEANP